MDGLPSTEECDTDHRMGSKAQKSANFVLSNMARCYPRLLFVFPSSSVRCRLGCIPDHDPPLTLEKRKEGGREKKKVHPCTNPNPKIQVQIPSHPKLSESQIQPHPYRPFIYFSGGISKETTLAAGPEKAKRKRRSPKQTWIRRGGKTHKTQ
jgi:hypothetical protein